MGSVYKVKVGSTNYDISPSSTGTLTGFTSDDATSPTEWKSIEAIASTDTNSSIFSKITGMVKNTRYLYRILGTGFSTSNTVTTQLSGKAPSVHTHTKSQITDFPESMPASDVYSWAKASNKPSYTYSEVGAAASSHTHTKSQITDFPESMPASDVYSWAKASSKPSYTYSEVGAAASSHSHATSDITSGVLPITRGGTGQNTLTPSVDSYAARVIKAGTDDMTAGTSSLTSGAIYLVYE